MCTVLLPPGDNPIVVNKYIISYHIIYHIYHIIYHIISYHISYHIISYQHDAQFESNKSSFFISNPDIFVLLILLALFYTHTHTHTHTHTQNRSWAMYLSKAHMWNILPNFAGWNVYYVTFMYRVIKKFLRTWRLQYRTIPTQLMSWRWPSQNTFRMWTVLYWTRSLRTQFGMSINVWRLAGDTLNITCNFLYCNHQVHRDFLITLYIKVKS